MEQKYWYLDHRNEFKKLAGKWIGLCNNTLVFATDYDLLSNELEKFRGTEIRPLLILVGSEDQNPSANVFISENSIINPQEQEERDEQEEFEEVESRRMAIQSLIHSREFQEDPLFKTECRLQSAEYCSNSFQRPVLSTLVSGRICSFLISPSSPFTFLSKRTLENIGLHNKQPYFDFWGGITYVGQMFGQQVLFRVSRENFEDLNILGYDIIKQHGLVFDKNKAPKWDPSE